MCACDRLSGSVGGTRLHFALYCADSGSKFTTAQTPVPSSLLRRLRSQISTTWPRPIGTMAASLFFNGSFMNLVALTTSLAPHYSCTSPMDSISHHSLHSHIPIHHYTNHTAVTNHSFALIVSPHLHLIHTHTFKQHTSMQTLRSVVLALADISERYPSCWLLSLCLTLDCPTLELWTCACDPDFCLVLFTSLPCLWYSCSCPLTFACLILPLSNKYLTANGSTRLWPVITGSEWRCIVHLFYSLWSVKMYIRGLLNIYIYIYIYIFFFFFCASLPNNQQLMKIIILLCLIYFGWPFHTLLLTPFCPPNLGIKWSKHGPSDSWKHICCFFTLKFYIWVRCNYDLLRVHLHHLYPKCSQTDLNRTLFSDRVHILTLYFYFYIYLYVITNVINLCNYIVDLSLTT